MSAYAECLPVFHSDGPLNLELSSDHQRPSTRRRRGSLYIRRSYETMVDGAMSWSVCRLGRDTRRFDDLRVELSSAITWPFVIGASIVRRRVTAGSQVLDAQDVETILEYAAPSRRCLSVAPTSTTQHGRTSLVSSVTAPGVAVV